MLYGAFSKGKSAYNSNLWTMRLELFGSFYVFVINATSTSRYIRLVCYLFFIATTPFDYYPLFAVGALLLISDNRSRHASDSVRFRRYSRQCPLWSASISAEFRRPILIDP